MKRYTEILSLLLGRFEKGTRRVAACFLVLFDGKFGGLMVISGFYIWDESGCIGVILLELRLFWPAHKYS